MTINEQDIHDKSNKVYVVLGMHKSGTSFVSKALFDQGVKMTDIDNHSFRRHYEYEEFLNLDKEILHAAGGYWKKPPTDEQLKTTHFVQRIKDIVAKQASKFWGWKDPRNAFTVEKYLDALANDDVYLICCFRKPAKVQESLVRAKGEDDYKELINTYNRKILQVVKDFVGLD